MEPVKELIHYVIVRKDLPLGTLAAMVTHAAGESGALYQDPYDGRFRGATAVVLGVNDEVGIFKAEQTLIKADIPHVVVVESGGPYDGQVMAIGVVPGMRSSIGPVLANYQVLKG